MTVHSNPIQSPYTENKLSVHPSSVHIPCWSGVAGISTGSGSEQVTCPPCFTAPVKKEPKTHCKSSDGLSAGRAGMLMSTWRQSAQIKGVMRHNKGERERRVRDEPEKENESREVIIFHLTPQLATGR